jgi:hypothetical protein
MVFLEKLPTTWDGTPSILIIEETLRRPALLLYRHFLAKLLALPRFTYVSSAPFDRS